MKAREFTCEMCRQTFDNGWSDEEATAEAESKGADVADSGLVCDDCYKLTSWGKAEDEDEDEDELVDPASVWVDY